MSEVFRLLAPADCGPCDSCFISMLADSAGSVAHCKGTQHVAFDGTKHPGIHLGEFRLQPRKAWRCVRFGTQLSRPSRRFWGCLAASLPEGQPDKASTQRHKVQANQALKSLEDAGKIGSEYGEVGTCGNFNRFAVLVACGLPCSAACIVMYEAVACVFRASLNSG